MAVGLCWTHRFASTGERKKAGNAVDEISKIHFMDATTNQELQGYTVDSVSGVFDIPPSLTANGMDYLFTTADLTHGATHTVSVPSSVPAGRIAYLWYAPKADLWNNGPGAPNAWFCMYDASPNSHRLLNVALDIEQDGHAVPLIAGWGAPGTTGYVHTGGAATKVIAPPTVHGAAFKGWAQFLGNQLLTGSAFLPNPLLIDQGWAGGCLAVYL